MSWFHAVPKALKHALLYAVLTAWFAPILSYAQAQAALSGTVTDASGAVIPGASVVARPLAGGNEERTVSDREGGFRFAQLISLWCNWPFSAGQQLTA